MYYDSHESEKIVNKSLALVVKRCILSCIHLHPILVIRKTGNVDICIALISLKTITVWLYLKTCKSKYSFDNASLVIGSLLDFNECVIYCDLSNFILSSKSW